MQLVLLCGLVGLLSATHAWNPNCLPKDKAVGFGSKTTGGAGGKTVKPNDIKELVKYLNSPGKLIIDLTKEFDFSTSEGYQTMAGCVFDKCNSGGSQKSLAHMATCDGKSKIQVKCAKAGLTENIISSDKTIMSSNNRGVIKGKGLRIKNAKNVIIRDITVSDINPDVIWAGDALVLDGVQDVWIHNVKVARVGRQHIVTYQKANTGITVSSCLFDGTTTNSAYCDGMHYWVMLFWGTKDQITLINNHIYKTSGRGPHAGGWSKSSNMIHIVGNEYDTNAHQGIEPKSGSVILAEGNTFNNYAAAFDPASKGGKLAMINTDKDAAQCVAAFKQKCLLNQFIKTKAVSRFDVAVLSQFKSLDVSAINDARSHASACRGGTKVASSSPSAGKAKAPVEQKAGKAKAPAKQQAGKAKAPPKQKAGKAKAPAKHKATRG